MPVLSAFAYGRYQSVFLVATHGLQAADPMGYLWGGPGDRPHPVLARILLLNTEFAA